MYVFDALSDVRKDFHCVCPCIHTFSHWSRLLSAFLSEQCLCVCHYMQEKKVVQTTAAGYKYIKT